MSKINFLQRARGGFSQNLPLKEVLEAVNPINWNISKKNGALLLFDENGGAPFVIPMSKKSVKQATAAASEAFVIKNAKILMVGEYLLNEGKEDETLATTLYMPGEGQERKEISALLSAIGVE